MKYVISLNHNDDNLILSEFDNLEDAFSEFKKLDVSELDDGQDYELAKYDSENAIIDWEERELNAIGWPINGWVVKGK